jgi:hypothetical protein
LFDERRVTLFISFSSFCRKTQNFKMIQPGSMGVRYNKLFVAASCCSVHKCGSTEKRSNARRGPVNMGEKILSKVCTIFESQPIRLLLALTGGGNPSRYSDA